MSPVTIEPNEHIHDDSNESSDTAKYRDYQNQPVDGPKTILGHGSTAIGGKRPHPPVERAKGLDQQKSKMEPESGNISRYVAVGKPGAHSFSSRIATSLDHILSTGVPLAAVFNSTLLFANLSVHFIQGKQSIIKLILTLLPVLPTAIRDHPFP